MNKKILAISVLIIILFAGALAGTIFYYNGQIANQNSQVSNLKSQLTNLTGQLTNFTGQLTTLNTANLVPALKVTEVPNSYNETGTYTGLNYLYISGGVTNIGRGTAYNAGLHVVAYTATGTLEINMTVPLGVGGYGEGVNNSTNLLGTTYGDSSFFSQDKSSQITTVYSGLVGRHASLLFIMKGQSLIGL